MYENREIHKSAAKTQGERDEEELKKRNKKSMNLYKTDTQNDMEIDNISHDVKNRLSFLSDDDKIRRKKEEGRIREEDRNVDLRKNLNGDTITRKGVVIQDSTAQVQPIEKWKQDIEKQKMLKKAKIRNAEITEKDRIKK